MPQIRDISLAPEGEKKIQWAMRNMPVLIGIKKDFERDEPLKGLRVALSVHMEAKTAVLCRTLEAGGAQMHVTGCNPLSTQDDVAAAVLEGGIDVYAWRNSTPEEYERHLTSVLEFRPNIIVDDGGDLVSLVHNKLRNLIPDVIGGCEETTTGIHRLRTMAKNGELGFPMIMVNDARCKYLFDNRYGSGQSVWDGINRTTNLIVAGKNVVVSGYGWCGKGIAMRAKGLGARVIVTEVDPVCALEAVMDGFYVMTMDQASAMGDIFVCVSGCRDIITTGQLEKMRDGAILCNAGHFNVEINMHNLEQMSVRQYQARENIMGYEFGDGRTLFLLAEGRLVNLASSDGHPVEIMDMSFAIQALSCRYLAENRGALPVDVISVPAEIDDRVARIKLASLGAQIDSLSTDQQEYLGI